jgi:hypothetical protein
MALAWLRCGCTVFDCLVDVTVAAGVFAHAGEKTVARADLAQVQVRAGDFKAGAAGEHIILEFVEKLQAHRILLA